MLRRGICLLPRLAFPKATPTSPLQSRGIFTDDFLRLSWHVRHQNKALLLTPDQAGVKANVRDKYAQDGVKGLNDEELKQFLLLSTQPAEADFLADVLQKAYKEGGVAFDIKNFTFRFFKLCYLRKWPEQSKALVDALPKDGSIGNFFYLMTLYSMGEYARVLEELPQTPDLVMGVNILTVGAAAAHQLGTREALDRVSALLSSESSSPRALALLAHLANRLGEHDRAHDLLLTQNSMLAVNVKVAVLVDMGKVDAALALLKQSLQSHTKTPLVTFEPAKKLIDAVREKYEEGSPQMAELKEVCGIIEEKAELAEQHSLAEALLEPIKPKFEHRQRQEKRQQQ